MGVKIVIDAGHGGTDPGAVNKNLGLREDVLALAMGQALSIVLKSRGYDVRNTRQGQGALNLDKSKDLSARAKLANDWGADYFISIHYNASGTGTASGAEVYCYKYPGTLAESIGKSIVKKFPNVKYRKSNSGKYAKEGNYAVLRQSKMQAALVECAFIDNNSDIRWFLDSANVKAFAEAIADGIKTLND